MLFKNVLVPFDESEHAQAALHLAIDFVGDDPTATIHIVTVVSNDIMPPSMISAAGAFGEVPIDYTSYESLLTSIAERSDRELRDSIGSILGKDLDAIKAKVVIDTRLAPSLWTGSPTTPPTIAATSSSWAGAAWAPARHARQRELRRSASSEIPVLTVK